MAIGMADFPFWCQNCQFGVPSYVIFAELVSITHFQVFSYFAVVLVAVKPPVATMPNELAHPPKSA
jgi:hypothetical protein